VALSCPAGKRPLVRCLADEWWAGTWLVPLAWCLAGLVPLAWCLAGLVPLAWCLAGLVPLAWCLAGLVPLAWCLAGLVPGWCPVPRCPVSGAAAPRGVGTRVNRHVISFQLTMPSVVATQGSSTAAAVKPTADW